MVLPATSTLCTLYSFFIASSPIFYSAAPRGTCSNCCAIRQRDDVRFLLYTRFNPAKPYYLYVGDNRRLHRSNFQYNSPLAIYLHGFSETATARKESSQQLKDAFLRAVNYNVILVDWSAFTAAPWYSNAVENLPIVGRYIARFLRFLNGQGYDTQHIHLIGFSMGGEAAGFVGKQMQEWGIILPRITGLDPALPLFEKGSSNHRLSSADASFVDVIHTDAGVLGHPDALGHADFYPNGGRPLQPGCALQAVNANRWLGILIGCSHQRAWEYFIESIKWPQAFPATSCQTSTGNDICRDGTGPAYMGIAADRRLRGKFFLSTNDAAPYGRQAPSAALIAATIATTTAADNSSAPTAQAATNAVAEPVNDTIKTITKATTVALSALNDKREALYKVTGRETELSAISVSETASSSATVSSVLLSSLTPPKGR